MKIIKLAAVILSLGFAYSAFAGTVNFAVANAQAGDAGTLALISPSSATGNAFQNCGLTGNGQVACGGFWPNFINSSLTVAVAYNSPALSAIPVGTINYAPQGGGVVATFTPNANSAGVTCTSNSNSPVNFSSSTYTAQIACAGPAPWSPNWVSFTPKIIFSASNGVTYSLAPASVSSLTANWGNYNGTTNLENNLINLGSGNNQYTLSYSLLSNGGGISTISGSVSFNLNFSPIAGGSAVSVPVTYTDTNDSFSLAASNGSSFAIDSYNSCSIGSPDGSGNITINCSYNSHVAPYSQAIAVTGAQDLTLGSTTMTGNPAWATNVSGSTFASGNYTLSFSADSNAYLGQAGDFTFSFPVTAGSSSTSQTINLDMNKQAGSSNLTLKLGQGTPASFSLQNVSTNTTYTCAPVITSNTLNLGCTTSQTAQPYTYSVTANNGLPDNVSLGTAMVAGSPPSDWTGIASSIVPSNGVYNYGFTAPINNYSTDAGTAILTIPVMVNGAATKASVVYTITKEANVAQPIASIAVTGGDSASTFTVPTNDPDQTETCAVSVSSALDDTGSYNLPLNFTCTTNNVPNDPFVYTVKATVNGGSNLSLAGLSSTATVTAPSYAVGAPGSVSSSSGVYTVPFSVLHGHYLNDQGNMVLTLSTGDSNNTNLTMNLLKNQGSDTLVPSLSSGATFNYTDANNNLYTCGATFTADPASATDFLLKVTCAQQTVNANYTVSLNAGTYSFLANNSSNLGASFIGATVSTSILPTYSNGAYTYAVSYNGATPSSNTIKFALTGGAANGNYSIGVKFNGGATESMSIDSANTSLPADLSNCVINPTGNNFVITCAQQATTATNITFTNNWAPTPRLLAAATPFQRINFTSATLKAGAYDNYNFTAASAGYGAGSVNLGALNTLVGSSSNGDLLLNGSLVYAVAPSQPVALQFDVKIVNGVATSVSVSGSNSTIVGEMSATINNGAIKLVYQASSSQKAKK